MRRLTMMSLLVATSISLALTLAAGNRKPANQTMPPPSDATAPSKYDSAALAADVGLKTLAISVDSDTVTLRGGVKTQQMASAMEAIASGVTGVSTVDN